MKKLLPALVFTLFIFNTYGQTLFTYGKHSVNAKEFLTAYNKNKTATPNQEQALRDYLDLYIKFKLKVQAAKDMRMDTLPSLQADLQNFRSQIQNSYLIDEKAVNDLVNEAFNRSQKDIHVVYYFVNTENTDSAKALKAVQKISEILANHPKEDIPSQIDSVKINKGDAGFITVFSLPYDLENIVYALKPGQISDPYHSKRGFYIFENKGERKAVGKITIAQILFAIPPGDNSQNEKVKKLSDSVYRALKNGGDFAALARRFSDDKLTYLNGGILPEFGTAKYDSVFENHAFDLGKDGDISNPFKTKFGYHIIKRISATPVPSSENDEPFMYNLKQEVLNDSRIVLAKKKFIEEILPLIGLKKNKINEENLWELTDSSLSNHKNIAIGNLNENTTLFSYNDHAETKIRDWLVFLNNSNKLIPGSHFSYKELFANFINASSVADYASRLEHFNPAFKAQIDEFKEGNLLFEVMQKKVWEKASADTSDLRNFYNSHKEKYFWNTSAEAIIFSCSNQIIASQIISQLKKRKNWREVVAENQSLVQADSGRFELGQIPVVERTNFTNGLITLPVVNKNDGTAVFSQIIKVYPGKEPRSYDDSRGLVINDYQNYLEEKWIEQLKKKYPVSVNEKTFSSLLNK